MGKKSTGRKAMTPEEIEQKYPKTLIEKYYLKDNLSKDKIAKKIGVCNEKLNKIIKYYNLKRDNNKIKSLKLSDLTSKKQQPFQELCKRISKEDIVKWYIEEDNDYKDAWEHYGITQFAFDKLCRYYNIKKDRSKTRYKGLETSKVIYGADNINNWKKAHQTRIEHFGSLEESYRQGFEKIKKTNLEKYGSEIIFNLPEHSHKKDSFPNLHFAHLLDENNIKYEREFVIETKSYDFKINNILIEINPTITHNALYNPYNKDKIGMEKNYHANKTKLAENNGYRCICVWDWDDENKIINLILNRKKIYARKCVIKIPTRHETEKFLNNYHLQGNARHSIRIGLYYEDELVSVMTFGKSRYNKHYEYELIRYCSSYNIIGGAEKLFKYFINNYNPKSIISYCDNSKFNGNTYIKLGFKLRSKGTPTCHWFNLKTKQHITDMLLRKNGFSRLIHHCEAKEDNLDTNNNTELMIREGFLPVYDCGQSSYVWERDK